MKNLLKKGQVFTCKKFADLVYRLKKSEDPQYAYDTPPTVDTKSLHFDHCTSTVCTWTEEGKDGWHRHNRTEIDLKPSAKESKSLRESEFMVVKTSLTGGGTGHGPHDIYPDGHHVVAVDREGREVEFYQTGCFVGMVEPKDIKWVSGPKDKE